MASSDYFSWICPVLFPQFSSRTGLDTFLSGHVLNMSRTWEPKCLCPWQYIRAVRPSCALPGFPGILLCGFLWLLSVCTLVLSGSTREPIFSWPCWYMIQCMLECLTCCIVLHPHSHNSKVINIYITQIWVYQGLFHMSLCFDDII